MGMLLGAWADRHTRFLPMLLPSVGNVISGIGLPKIEENGGLVEPKIVKNRGLEGLGAALGAFR